MKNKEILGAALAVGLTTVASASAAIHVPNTTVDTSNIFAMNEVSSPSLLAMSSNGGDDKSCGEKSCGEKSCGEKSCGEKSCGEGSCGSH